jgi:hypothetical protein
VEALNLSSEQEVLEVGTAQDKDLNQEMRQLLFLLGQKQLSLPL